MKWLFACLASVVMVSAACAAEQEPDQLIKSVTEEVLSVVRTDKEIQSGNTKKAVALIETKVLPNFNFTHMTQLALGREWRNATPAQQTSLTNEFRTLLVRTYSKALTEYRNQTIDYKPFALKAGETDTKVRTQVNQANGKPIALDYSLEKQNSAWKVYD
ncbi:MAG TPA: ABC transporter substrate-binding protein, partial [Rhodocyclaceae bacterium]|nr:ABC transporter substrate-binding protein [Rhodocyclaceae bacterium]